MPKFLVLEDSYLNDTLATAGSIVDFEPQKHKDTGEYLYNDNLELLDDDADEEDKEVAKKARKAKADAGKKPDIEVTITDESEAS